MLELLEQEKTSPCRTKVQRDGVHHNYLLGFREIPQDICEYYSYR